VFVVETSLFERGDRAGWRFEIFRSDALDKKK
jgi:hypothetical protein